MKNEMNCANCMFSKKDVEYDNIILCPKILEGISSRAECSSYTEMVVNKDFCCIFWLPLIK